MARPQATAIRSTLNFVNQQLSGGEMQRQLAMFARAELGRLQADGSAPEYFLRYVNGRLGASEETVVLPGPIIYDFSWLPEATEFGLAYAQAISPRATGEFARHWFVMDNGRRITDYSQIAPDSEVVITNDMPFARRAEVGGMRIHVPPGFVEATRQAIQAKFGNVLIAERQFIALQGGQAAGQPVPYIIRHGKRAGQEVTYPAVVLRTRYV